MSPWSQVTLRNVPFKREYFRTEAAEVIKGRVAAIKHLLAAGRGLEDPDILLLRLGLSGNIHMTNNDPLPSTLFSFVRRGLVRACG